MIPFQVYNEGAGNKRSVILQGINEYEESKPVLILCRIILP
jgi:hypothetical protein